MRTQRPSVRELESFLRRLTRALCGSARRAPRTFSVPASDSRSRSLRAIGLPWPTRLLARVPTRRLLHEVRKDDPVSSSVFRLARTAGHPSEIAGSTALPGAKPSWVTVSLTAAFAASLGATVLMFQHILGHPGVNFQVPIIVYLFVASIGTDYNILIISRLREEVQQGAAPRDAARTAVRRAGPAVAAAGLVLAASFALLTISPPVADIGFAVATGALMCAFINASLLIPALTAIAGRAAWWPSHPGAGRHSATTAPDASPSIEAT